MGDCQTEPLRPQFDRRLRRRFFGAQVTSDAGLRAYGELDDALDRTQAAASERQDPRPGKQARPRLTALLRQSISRRLAGSEARNDAERLRVDPALRTVGGGRARDTTAASTSAIARFETETRSSQTNRNGLRALSGQGIDRAHPHRTLTKRVLDMDSSVRAT